MVARSAAGEAAPQERCRQGSYPVGTTGTKAQRTSIVHPVHGASHETPGLAKPALLVDLPGKERDEAPAIPVVGEDRLTCIAARGDVINRTGKPLFPLK